MPFETFGFATNYSVELNPEQPGAGWGDRQRVQIRPGVNEAVLAEVTPTDRVPWLVVDGSVPSEPLRALATPNPDAVLFIAGQYIVSVHLMDVNLRRQIVVFEANEAHAYGFRALGLLLVASPYGTVAIGPEGIAWKADRLALGGLSVLEATVDGIVCEGYFGGDRPSRFTIDPSTGQQISGPVFKDPFRRRAPWRPFRRKSS